MIERNRCAWASALEEEDELSEGEARVALVSHLREAAVEAPFWAWKLNWEKLVVRRKERAGRERE